MSHRARSRATHLLTVERPTQTGTDTEGEPIFDPDQRAEVVANEPVRFRPGGTSFVREESGERVRRMPTASGRASLVETVSEGDIATLTPMDASIDDADGASFEVVAVDGAYGRRGRPARSTIELEAK